MGKQIDCLLVGYRSDEDYSYYQDFANRFLCGEKIEKLFNGMVSYLGTYLHRRGISFDYINYIEDEYGLLEDKMKNNNYHAICLSTTYIMEMKAVKILVKKIRELHRSDNNTKWSLYCEFSKR